MAGIRLTTLAYAAATKNKIHIVSLQIDATVSIRDAPLDANHSYPIDYIVTLVDMRSYKVCWDRFFRAHVFDLSDNEVELDI